MTLLDGPLGAIFAAAFGALFRDAVLHRMTETDSGGGLFAATPTDLAVKVSADAIGTADRAASGLPANAVRFIILTGTMTAPPSLDDELTLAGATYRLIRVDADPAQASVTAAAVPV